MALSNSILDREFEKFELNSEGETATNVIVDGLEDSVESINENLEQIDSDLLAFKAESHADNLTIESKQDAQTALLTEIEEDTDSIETKLDAVNTKLDTANATLTTIDSDLNTFKNANHSDLLAIEGKQDAQTALLTEIEQELDDANTNLVAFQAANHADLLVIEGKQDTTNTKLTTLDTDLLAFKAESHADNLVIEGKQDSTNTKLDSLITQTTAINNNTDTLETLIASTNAKIDTANTNLTTLDTDLNAFKSANHTDLLAIKTDIDSTNTKLDSLSTAATTGNSLLTDIKANQTNGTQKTKDYSNATGSTVCYAPSATTSVQSLPSSIGDNIRSVVILSGTGVGVGQLMISYDGGTTYDTMPNGSSISLDPIFGNIKQLKYKIASGTSNSFRAIIGFIP